MTTSLRWSKSHVSFLRAAISVPQPMTRPLEEFARKIAPAFNAGSQLDANAIEAVIRDALGEADTIPASITTGQRFVSRSIVASALSVVMGLDQTAVDHLVIQSEEAAFRQGWKPLLAG